MSKLDARQLESASGTEESSRQERIKFALALGISLAVAAVGVCAVLAANGWF